jgi:uncharacterized protein YbjT (DUF2867 family)
MILIAGATGVVGGIVCKRLRDRGESVRALVRVTSSPDKVDRLRALGVEIFSGDLRDPASLDAAARGATTVISTVSMVGTAQAGDSFQDTDNAGTRALIDAAKRAGSSHFIFVSFDHGAYPDSPLGSAKRDVEEYLRESGVPYTVIQSSLFMEIWLGPHLGVDVAAATAKVFGSGDQPLNYISVRDVAEYIVHCVGAESVVNRTLCIGGPESLSQRDAVRLFEEAFGTPFQVTEVPEAALEAQWTNAPDPFTRTFSALMLGAARGDRTAARDLERPFPIALTSVRDYVTELAAPKR